MKLMMTLLRFLLLVVSVSCIYNLKNMEYSKTKKMYKGVLKTEGKYNYKTLHFEIYEGRISRVRIFPTEKESPNRWKIPEHYYNFDSVFSPYKPGDMLKIKTNAINEVFFLILTRVNDGVNVINIEKLQNYTDMHINFSIELDSIFGEKGSTKGENDENKENSFQPKSNIYGLGEHSSPFKLKNNQTYTIFNKNHHVVTEGLNLYGSHPFFLHVLKNGYAQGILFLNSNAMDVHFLEHTLTFDVIGGIIDLLIFTGPGPEEVIKQYHEFIGQPAMPPAFALGFHQCKYGYKSLKQLEEVVSNYKKHEIPLESIWSDIDYMDHGKTFTVSKSFKGIKKFVDRLHKKHQHYISIIDPGIKIDPEYKIYNEGMKYDVFIKNASGSTPMRGEMFCGFSYFPDFEHPNITKFWRSGFESLYKMVEIDGVWLDQNELTSFCTGFCEGDYFYSKYDHPKYYPGTTNLSELSLSLSSKQWRGIHYNTHNLYPLEETNVTKSVLDEIRGGRRSLIVSRSSFPGLGRYSGHWLGDNDATWDDMHKSISGILSFNLFGIPFVGADIGGFYRNTSEEMMIRWVELGTFYPFMRNHAHKSVLHQELYTFSQRVIDISKKMIAIRYEHFSYLYTQFYKVHTGIDTVVIGSMMMHYPYDLECMGIDRQFFVGKDILVVPVLNKSEREDLSVNVEFYLPENEIWYRMTGSQEMRRGWITRNVKINELMIYYKGGAIIPMRTPKSTIHDTMKSQVELIVALDSDKNAEGELYLDDGESVDVSDFYYIKFKTKFEKSQWNMCTEYNIISNEVIEKAGNFNESIILNKIRLFKISDLVRVYLSTGSNGEKDILMTDYSLENDILEINFDGNSIMVYDKFEMRICYKTTMDRVFQIVFFVAVGICVVIIIGFFIYVFILYFQKKRELKKNEKNRGYSQINEKETEHIEEDGEYEGSEIIFI